MCQSVLHNPQLKRWRERIESNGNEVLHLEVLASVYRNGSQLVGSFLDTVLLTSEGQKIARCFIMKGDSVVVVPVLICDDDCVYTLMVEQRRIIDGGLALEFPAGSLDKSSDDPRETACREVKEELHLTIAAGDMLPLADRPVKVNTSSSADLVYFFYFQQNVTRLFIEDMEGHITGCHEDNEYIRVRVRKMSEVGDVLTSSALIGVRLLEKKLARRF